MGEEMIRWKASQARPWAESMVDKGLKADALRDAVAAFSETFDGIGAVRYDKGPVSSHIAHGDDVFAALVARLDDAIGSYAGAVDEYVREIRSFVGCCMMLDGTSARLLVMRYVDRAQWCDVAEALCYSEGHVKNKLHTAALAALYDVMPHTLRDPFPNGMNSDFLS